MRIIDRIIDYSFETPDKEVLIDTHKRLNYKDLLEEIMILVKKINNVIGNDFAAIGLLFSNSVELITWMLAAEYSGLPVILFSNKMKMEEINYHMNRIEIGALVVEKGHNLNNIINIKQIYHEPNYSILIPPKENSCDKQFEVGDYLCHFTSGSEGNAKAVVRTRAGIIAEIRNTYKKLKLGDNKTFLTIPPICHSFGLVAGALMPLYFGHKLILMNNFMPEKALRLVEVENVDVMFAVPYMYYLFEDILVKSPKIVNNMEYCFTAGAPLNKELRILGETFKNAKIVQDYGSTETGVICLNMDTEHYPKSVGKVVDGIELTLFDSYLKEGKMIGEIGVKGERIFRKYIYPNNYNIEKFRDEYWRSGDLGYVDEEGYVYIVGRVNMLINVAGNKVDPVEIENVISEIKGVDRVAISAKSNSRIENVIVALVVRDDVNVSELQIKRYCSEKLADFKIPRIIKFVDDLPTSHTGKIMRKKLEDFIC